MARKVARYTVTNGLSGCYMPDHHHGAIEFATRRDFASYIRYELEQLDFPASAIRQISIRNIWRHIARHGSSSAHFSISHNGYELAFYGLTDEEFEAEQAASDE